MFENYNNKMLTSSFFQILIKIINRYQYQTAHNLILSHTILCFYFNQLSADERELFCYFILRVKFDELNLKKKKKK